MYTAVQSFIEEYRSEAELTQKLLHALTDESLKQEVAPGYRTLGRLAWHLVHNDNGMLQRTGLKFDAPSALSDPPASAPVIAETYRRTAQAILEAVQNQWTDENLEESANIFGEPWKHGFTLSAFVKHEIHHRGQLSILMRQAGLQVPGIYGPSKEEWAVFGMDAPKI